MKRKAPGPAGEPQVDAEADPVMGSEDFAFMPQAKPGCYIWLGNGEAGGLTKRPGYSQPIVW